VQPAERVGDVLHGRRRAALLGGVGRGEAGEASPGRTRLAVDRVGRIRPLVGAKVHRNDVEDVCSRATERMLHRIYDESEKPRSFQAMLTTLTRWCIADHYREQRPEDPVDAVPEPAAEDQGIRELLARDEADRLLSALDAREREILVGLAEAEAAPSSPPRWG
jgi:DNA-directed RNA polymerase specialized sigma24 family protein